MNLGLLNISSNPLYHEFTPGFNWWYVVVPATFVVCFMIGYLPIKRRWNKNIRFVVGLFKLAVPAILGFLSADLIRKESWLGILQWFDNGAVSASETIYTGFFAIFAMVTIYFVTMGVCVWLAITGNDTRRMRRKKKFGSR